MDFRKHLKAVPPQFDIVPFGNVFFLVAVFFLLAFFFSGSGSLSVAVPKWVTSDMAAPADLTIIVTSENIMYVNKKLTTLRELKDLLVPLAGSPSAILIKADHRASVGCIVDIWNLGRSMGIGRINMATDREE